VVLTNIRGARKKKQKQPNSNKWRCRYKKGVRGENKFNSNTQEWEGENIKSGGVRREVG